MAKIKLTKKYGLGSSVTSSGLIDFAQMAAEKKRKTDDANKDVFGNILPEVWNVVPTSAKSSKAGQYADNAISWGQAGSKLGTAMGASWLGPAAMAGGLVFAHIQDNKARKEEEEQRQRAMQQEMWNARVGIDQGVMYAPFGGSVPIQAEKHQGQKEMMHLPNGVVMPTQADTSHEAMSSQGLGNKATDVVPEGTNILSARNKSSAKDLKTIIDWLQNTGVSVDNSIVDELPSKGKVSPAELGEMAKRKYGKASTTNSFDTDKLKQQQLQSKMEKAFAFNEILNGNILKNQTEPQQSMIMPDGGSVFGKSKKDRRAALDLSYGQWVNNVDEMKMRQFLNALNSFTDSYTFDTGNRTVNAKLNKLRLFLDKAPSDVSSLKDTYNSAIDLIYNIAVDGGDKGNNVVSNIFEVAGRPSGMYNPNITSFSTDKDSYNANRPKDVTDDEVQRIWNQQSTYPGTSYTQGTLRKYDILPSKQNGFSGKFNKWYHEYGHKEGTLRDKELAANPNTVLSEEDQLREMNSVYEQASKVQRSVKPTIPESYIARARDVISNTHNVNDYVDDLSKLGTKLGLNSNQYLELINQLENAGILSPRDGAGRRILLKPTSKEVDTGAQMNSTNQSVSTTNNQSPTQSSNIPDESSVPSKLPRQNSSPPINIDRYKTPGQQSYVPPIAGEEVPGNSADTMPIDGGCPPGTMYNEQYKLCLPVQSMTPRPWEQGSEQINPFDKLPDGSYSTPVPPPVIPKTWEDFENWNKFKSRVTPGLDKNKPPFDYEVPDSPFKFTPSPLKPVKDVDACMAECMGQHSEDPVAQNVCMSKCYGVSHDSCADCKAALAESGASELEISAMCGCDDVSTKQSSKAKKATNPNLLSLGAGIGANLFQMMQAKRQKVYDLPYMPDYTDQMPDQMPGTNAMLERMYSSANPVMNAMASNNRNRNYNNIAGMWSDILDKSSQFALNAAQQSAALKSQKAQAKQNRALSIYQTEAQRNVDSAALANKKKMATADFASATHKNIQDAMAKMIKDAYDNRMVNVMESQAGMPVATVSGIPTLTTDKNGNLIITYI